jgi:regulator of nucleoside diphosphate kinase
MRVTVTDRDVERLLRVIADVGDLRDHAEAADLVGELSRAEVVPSEHVPVDVVTMDSTVLLRDVDSSQATTVTVVFPERADASLGRVSVLAPVGTAILGFAVGDLVEWPVPSGVRRLRIEALLYQPEAAGVWT